MLIGGNMVYQNCPQSPLCSQQLCSCSLPLSNPIDVWLPVQKAAPRRASSRSRCHSASAAHSLQLHNLGNWQRWIKCTDRRTDTHLLIPHLSSLQFYSRYRFNWTKYEAPLQVLHSVSPCSFYISWRSLSYLQNYGNFWKHNSSLLCTQKGANRHHTEVK
jgi:hypothetical protein